MDNNEENTDMKLWCHFTPMMWECGDSDDLGNCEEWYTCKHCGCTKDTSGHLIKD